MSKKEDADLQFYKHREWKPGKDAVPVASPVEVSKDAGSPSSAASPANGSAWNTAGTWEERSQKAWAVEDLTKKLTGLTAPVEGGGEVVVKSVTITGDASITFIRGKKKFPFDFKLEFTISGPNDMKCEVVIQDFACDEDAPYEMEFSWKGDSAPRTPASKDAVGATSKQVKQKAGLFHHIHTALDQWIQDFQKL